MKRWLLLVALAAAAAAPTVWAGTPRLVHVAVIGDSVPTAMAEDPAALATLGHGIDLDLDVVACRRLDLPSCVPTGATTAPLNVVEMARAKLPLGPVTVLVCGYNDKENLFPQEIEDTLSALRDDGVKRVLWLNLREARHPYVAMNDDLAAAAAKHPELTVLDWNTYSRSHPDWFADDGLHLVNPVGGEAMATFIHDRLVAAHIAVAPLAIAPLRLRTARRGVAYSTRLATSGGLAPFTWSLVGPVPAGIHLLASGVLHASSGAAAGNYALTVSVRDALGDMISRTLAFRIR